ncbi:MAG: hypothetical protein ABI325_00485 [Ginsengibacter sp.]
MDIYEINYIPSFPAVMRLSVRDINTIKNIVDLYYKENNIQTCERLALKVQTILKIKTDMQPLALLETLLADYNYLTTK